MESKLDLRAYLLKCYSPLLRGKPATIKAQRKLALKKALSHQKTLLPRSFSSVSPPLPAQDQELSPGLHRPRRSEASTNVVTEGFTSYNSPDPNLEEFLKAPKEEVIENLYKEDYFDRQRLCHISKMRTLNGLADITSKYISRSKSPDLTEDIPEDKRYQTIIYPKRYEIAVSLTKSQSHLVSKEKPIPKKVLINLPPLPFGKHVPYNSVHNFKSTHLIEFDAKTADLAEISRSIWINKLITKGVSKKGVKTKPVSIKKQGRNITQEERNLFLSRTLLSDSNLYNRIHKHARVGEYYSAEKTKNINALMRLKESGSPDLSTMYDSWKD